VWLRAGEGMAFTAMVAAEVASRLGRNEGRPGAYTPGSLFGPELVAHAGGQFSLDRGKRALIQAGGAGISRRVLAAMRPSLFDQVADHRR
jgi:hypothetical protein